MTQDFAKIRPEPILDRKPEPPAPAWSYMLTGVVVGMAIGVFACVLLYLSGQVPPLTSQVVATAEPAAQSPTDDGVAQGTEADLELEFYYELPNYVVDVDATPVELTAEQSGESVPVNYLLQTGAFSTLDSAEREADRLQALGLNVYVRHAQTADRTWFLVQSGPYLDSLELNRAEQILRRNNVPRQRISLQ